MAGFLVKIKEVTMNALVAVIGLLEFSFFEQNPLFYAFQMGYHFTVGTIPDFLSFV